MFACRYSQRLLRPMRNPLCLVWENCVAAGVKPFLMMGLFCKIDTCSSLLLHIPAARFMYLFLRRAQFISTVRKHTSQNIAILRQSSHLHSGVSDDCERRAWPLQRQLRLTGLGLWQRIHVRRCIIFHFSTLHALYSALF